MPDDYSLFTSPSSAGALHSLLTLRTRLATTLFTSHVYYQLIEAAFFLLIIYLAFTRAYKPWARHSAPRLSAAEEAARLSAWKPAPLSAAPITHYDLPVPAAATRPDIEIESGGAGPTATVRGYGPVVNAATTNFLGLLKSARVEQAALQTMRDYGCGACGPRGFYGTTDIHLECEAAIARFSGTQSAILYSFGAATASSTIPAFVKRGDLLVVDSALPYPLRAGAKLSRARILPFKHNDMADLERVLAAAVRDEGAHDSARAQTQRRLILVEGVSSSTGAVAPLRDIVALKNRFRFRLLLDESLSIGVLGHAGRGSLQEFHIDRSDVEFATADLGNALASVGGFCVGRDDVVDHQRLSGAGYCFSASQPPFLAKAATTAIGMLEEDGQSFVDTLRARINNFHQHLPTNDLRCAGWTFLNDPRSPIVLFSRTRDDLPVDRLYDAHRLCLEQGVLVAPPICPPDDPIDISTNKGKGAQHSLGDDVYRKPSIRISISAAHSEEQIRKVALVTSQVLLGLVDKL